MNETNELLRELVTWTKVTSYKQVKQTLETVLIKPQDRLVFHLTDGAHTGLQISKETGVNNATISGLQSAWAKMGLVAKGDHGYKKHFLLEDFGIDVPTATEIKKRK